MIAVEGDLSRELIDLRDKRANATAAKAKLLSILVSTNASESAASIAHGTVADVLIDGFISSLRFESRITNLRKIAVNTLIRSGDLSPDEAQSAVQRLLTSIKAESLQTQATLITFQVLNDWLGIPQRSILQKKPVPDPYEVDRKDLVERVASQLEKTNVILLHGIPKVGKSHLVSGLIDHVHMDHSYFWFTF